MFQSGLEIAEKNGYVIMIGHVWSGSHLAQILDELGKKQYRMVLFLQHSLRWN